MSEQTSPFFLYETTGPHPAMSFPLTGSEITIGRLADNHVVLDDTHVSRHHARLVWHGSGYSIEDLRSGNGTWVNEQRIVQSTPLKPGDVIGISPRIQLEFRLASADGELTQYLPPPQSRQPAAAGGGGILSFGTGALIGSAVVAVVLLVVGALVCLLAGGGRNDKRATATTAAVEVTAPDTPTQVAVEVTIPDTPTPSGEPTQTVQAGTPIPPFELARRATVFVVAFLDEKGEEGYTGSGSVVDTRGYILTNYHVVQGTIEQYVGLNSARQDAPPEDFYRVEVVTFDQALDLALLKIIGDVDGNPLKGALILPIMEIGDSDSVNLGDPVTILGFPGLGEDTLTLTKGTVAGFVDDTDLDLRRGWIKTDAEISSGNSGGVAIDSQGRLIGVPTQVTYNTESVGVIGLVRPINLAKKLLDEIP